MTYSQVQLANVALGRIGAANRITSVSPPDGSPNSIKVNAVWDVIFKEVLSERDWKFAKSRATLQKSSTAPLYGYQNAWALPADFLRFVRPHKRPMNTWSYCWGSGPEGAGWYNKLDPPMAPVGYPYIVESMPVDGNMYVMTDYDGSDASCPNVLINYIQLISDYTKLMPGFVNCFCNRLAAELAIPVTEDPKKFQAMMGLYRDTLNSAMAQNECLDYLANEAGSNSWTSAGRGGGFF